MYQTLELERLNEFYDSLDANHALEDLFEEGDSWNWFEQTDYALPLLPPPRAVRPETVRLRVRRALRGQPLAVGEIVPISQTERGLGQLVRRKEQGYRRGQRAIVTYDRRGNVYMRVYTPGMNPTSGWFQIGSVTTQNLPSQLDKRGAAIEKRIRALVERATGIAIRPKHGNTPGADLVRDPNRIVSRSPAGVGRRSRFDYFAATYA